MADTERAGFWRVNNPIMWACLVTAGFVGLIIWFGLAETCNADLFPKGDCPPKWRHLQVAPPNEVGDTLAGLAGVLAFIWLIATVLLQSVELGEQRRVLTLQKEEMEEQRKATQDMARSLKVQADIFEDEQRQRKRVSEVQLITTLIASINTLAAEADEMCRWTFSNPEGPEFPGVVVDKPFKYSDDPKVRTFYICLQKAFQEVEDLIAQGFRLSGSPEGRVFEELLPVINKLLLLGDRLGEEQHVRIQNLRLQGLKKEIMVALEKKHLWEPVEAT